MNQIAKALSALNALDPECSREVWVKIGMAAKCAGLSSEDFINWSCQAGNFKSENDCKHQWATFHHGRGITEKSLFYLAREAGWKPEEKYHQRSHYLKSPYARRLDIKRLEPDKSIQKSLKKFWDRLPPAPGDHSYILEKCGRPDGLRVVPHCDDCTISGNRVAGWLVVPVRCPAGELQTLQFIPPENGKKLNYPGATFGDGLFVVGEIDSSDRLYIVEGLGQAWACSSATGCAAVVSFGAGRMTKVANSLRARYPRVQLLVVPDRGQEKLAESIARNTSAEWIRLPEDKPNNYDVNDYAGEYGAEELKKILTSRHRPHLRYALLAASEVSRMPSISWLIRNILPTSGLASIYGASMSGKSFLAIDMAAAIAEGKSWFNHRAKSAPVVYLALEGEHGIRQRLKAWETHHKRPMPQSIRFVMQPFNLRSQNDLRDISDAIKLNDSAGGLLVIDTLNRAAGNADENSSREMGELIASAKWLQLELGGLVLIIHHTGKDPTKGHRGHSSLLGALDAAIEVSRSGETREWSTGKEKDERDNTAYQFRLQVIETDLDEFGTPITSCVVVPVDGQTEAKKVKSPRGSTQKQVFNALNDLLQKSTTFGMAGAPENMPCVELDSAVNFASQNLIGPRSDQRNYQTVRAIDSMIENGFYQTNGGWIWEAR